MQKVNKLCLTLINWIPIAIALKLSIEMLTGPINFSLFSFARPTKNIKIKIEKKKWNLELVTELTVDKQPYIKHGIFISLLITRIEPRQCLISAFTTYLTNREH